MESIALLFRNIGEYTTAPEHFGIFMAVIAAAIIIMFAMLVSNSARYLKQQPAAVQAASNRSGGWAMIRLAVTLLAFSGMFVYFSLVNLAGSEPANSLLHGVFMKWRHIFLFVAFGGGVLSLMCFYFGYRALSEEA